MKMIGWVSTGFLSLLLVGSTAVVAQDKPDEDKPPRQEEPKKDDAKPPKDTAKPSKPDDVKPEKRDAQESRDQDKVNQERENQERVNNEHQQGMEHAQAGGKSTRIPDDKFRASFGRSHTVVINRPVIVEGQPRFQSGGYWFVISDPWPAGWAYSDQCYIDYIDGEYFLFDLLHPGVRIALIVNL
jgi:hypothetical protein